MLKIEKNVPIPVKRKPKTLYPWSGMALGDSFIVEDDKSDPTLQSAIGSLGKQWAKTRSLRRKYTTRKVEGGIRVWRIE